MVLDLESTLFVVCFKREARDGIGMLSVNVFVHFFIGTLEILGGLGETSHIDLEDLLSCLCSSDEAG